MIRYFHFRDLQRKISIDIAENEEENDQSGFRRKIDSKADSRPKNRTCPFDFDINDLWKGVTPVENENQDFHDWWKSLG